MRFCINHQEFPPELLKNNRNVYVRPIIICGPPLFSVMAVSAVMKGRRFEREGMCRGNIFVSLAQIEYDRL